ncbi:hypothetical protein HUJ05_001226 [Dendroctonus ponderosae]|nr:hypothetical protein HUJ05_001226 [Dendroctonus ponderosae]
MESKLVLQLPGHKRIDGNEKADLSAKQGAEKKKFLGPEPVLGVIKSTMKDSLKCNGIDTSAISVPAGPSLSDTRHFTSKITPPFYNRSSKCSPPLMHAMTRNLFTIHERQNVRVSRFSFDIVMWPDNVLHSLKFIDDNSRKFMDHTPNVTVSSLRQIKEESSPR